MDRKFIYFINPISGTKGKAMVSEIIKKITTDKGIPFEILPTNAEGNYSFLSEKITKEKITDILICGGDGTVNQLAKAILGIEVNIGIIPMGSGNGLARSAKIPKRLDKALQVIFTGKTAYIDSFYINQQFSCMLSGLGFDAQVALDFAAQKKRGLMTYINQSFKNFIKAKTYPFVLSLNGIDIDTNAYFISIANSNQFGNNFTIAPQASLHDGLLDIVVVNKMSKMKMVWSVLKQLKNGQVRIYEDKKYHGNEIHYFQTKNLTILNPQMAPLHIDGDPAITSQKFEIAIIENAFKLLMP